MQAFPVLWRNTRIRKRGHLPIVLTIIYPIVKSQGRKAKHDEKNSNHGRRRFYRGSHVADELLAKGNEVRDLDALSQQVHGPKGTLPEF